MTQALNLANFANHLNTAGATNNSGLQNSSVNVTAGTGMSGGGAVALGSSVTLTNAGVTSIVAGTGISVSGATGGVTVTNTAQGKILQVLQVFRTSTFSTSASSYVDVTGLSITITPTFSSSQILVMAQIPLSANYYGGAQLVRNSSPIFIGTGGNVVNSTLYATASSYVDATVQGGTIIYLDSPSTTSSVTYKIQIFSNAGTAYVGAPYLRASDVAVPSSIVVMEVLP